MNHPSGQRATKIQLIIVVEGINRDIAMDVARAVGGVIEDRVAFGDIIDDMHAVDEVQVAWHPKTEALLYS